MYFIQVHGQLCFIRPYCDRDFQAQQRFARANFNTVREMKFSLFGLNVKTCEVRAFDGTSGESTAQEPEEVDETELVRSLVVIIFICTFIIS